MDESMVTGESMPIHKEDGADVIGATVREGERETKPLLLRGGGSKLRQPRFFVAAFYCETLFLGILFLRFCVYTPPDGPCRIEGKTVLTSFGATGGVRGEKE